MKRVLTALLVGVGLTALSAARAEDKKPATPAAAPTNEVAVLKFKDFGDITFEFLPGVAPKTVENFKKLAREKFYDGTKSHRLIPGFMIQLGDPLTKNDAMESRWGGGDPGYKIDAEFNGTSHRRGVVSMARLPSGANTAGCQFFICFGDAPHLDRQYTAFAKVIKGIELLDKLERVPVGGPAGSRPQTPVVLETVTLTPAPAAAKPAAK
jgi:peptidyl-prolyl cis-trans isomerase B (cyclophilin B)